MTENEIILLLLFWQVSPDANDTSCLIVIWPMTLVHVIDKDSPFYR